MTTYRMKHVVISWILLSGCGVTSYAQNEVPASRLEEAWGFTAESPRYLLQPHQMNYFLPITHTSRRNTAPWEPFKVLGLQEGERNLDDVEAKFQISFRQRIWATDDQQLGAWVAYTQLSTWQVYNDDESHPFRDTNYLPEFFLSYNPRVHLGYFRWSLLNVGVIHESNGRAELISRSWDRLYAEAGLEKGNFVLLPRIWYRFEDGSDDNPDITDTYGYGQLTAFYRWGDRSLTLTGRGNVSRGKGSVQASYVSPPFMGP
ncbi:MAG TPA: phospholipase A, partial [Kiritimatiellia bacterium]|nr:phospholipase A [Kiritimatiellia bacterium]